jgi:hypothetical protein
VRDPSFSSHAVSPQSVLHAYREIRRSEPPPAFVLGVRGHGFELGADLSTRAEANLESAWTFLQGLLAVPTAEAWAAKAT